MPTPFPHQIDGARFLANNTAALLADDPRVGKTGTSIMACDFVLARKVLILTTATARANWAREVADWQKLPRTIKTVYECEDLDLSADVIIVAWSIIYDRKLLNALMAVEWDVFIIDESHYAKTLHAKRTGAVYGGLHRKAQYVWCLSGTPTPNAPNDLYPMLRALYPKALDGIATLQSFTDRFCVTKRRFLNGRLIEVVKGGKNLDELKERISGFMLRRTQTDVGIRRPIFSLYTLHATGGDAAKFRAAAKSINAEEVIDAIETGTRVDDIHMSELRRITGFVKADSVGQAVKELLDGGLDKIVLMYWHKDVGARLEEVFSSYGVVRLDGSVSPVNRQPLVDRFQKDPECRVFLGQIIAAGEAIDLSAAAELWFVEPSFVPKDMAQAAMRITNHAQKRQALVRVCALEGSFDEAMMRILTRKVESITKLMEQSK